MGGATSKWGTSQNSPWKSHWWPLSSCSQLFFHSFSIFFLSDRDNMRWSARQGGKKPNGWWLIAHFPPIEPQKRGIPHFWPKPYIYNFIYVKSNVVFLVTIWSIFQTELVGWMSDFLSKHSWYSHQRSKVKNFHCITWLPFCSIGTVLEQRVNMSVILGLWRIGEYVSFFRNFRSVRHFSFYKYWTWRFHWEILHIFTFIIFIIMIFPESVWAQGSSNSGGLSLIFSSSHLLIFTSSHLHIFSSSHLLIFTSSHLHIFSSSSHIHILTSSHLLIFTSSHHLHTFTSSHLHICSSSHLLILTSSHLLIFTSSHLLIFTSAHLHIFTSSHLLIFTSSHPHIFTSSHLHIFTSSHLHICSSSHLHIFTSAYLHIFSSSHLHIFSSCLLALLPSCPHIFTSSPLALSFFSISLLKAGAGAVPTRRHETQPFHTKWGSIAKNWGKIAISTCPAQPFRTK